MGAAIFCKLRKPNGTMKSGHQHGKGLSPLSGGPNVGITNSGKRSWGGSSSSRANIDDAEEQVSQGGKIETNVDSAGGRNTSSGIARAHCNRLEIGQRFQGGVP
ncbi:hypothetical protein SASPL_152613 [Salvia splendens]|uniref:Uncharacterized protein n=1 Tax=Salvia splendens TaxID=180675 RepID=A0A8X8W3L1_SALSN|nr:hypothetical protein SASPL_152613 [Salvia splendens]